jgi:hypothetical protein
MSQLPSCIQYIQALGPTFVAVVVGCVAGYVAWRQWRTAHDRLKFDLYEKRFAVYETVKKLSDVATMHVDPKAIHGSHVSPEDLHEFFNAIRGSQFLFGGDARKFLVDIQDMYWEATNTLARLGRSPRHDPVGTEWEQLEIVKFLADHNKALEDLFKPYIDLSKVGLTSTTDPASMAMPRMPTVKDARSN